MSDPTTEPGDSLTEIAREAGIPQRPQYDFDIATARPLGPADPTTEEAEALINAKRLFPTEAAFTPSAVTTAVIQQEAYVRGYLAGRRKPQPITEAPDSPEAPVWYSGDMANGWDSGWRSGYEAALEAAAALSQDGEI